MSGHEWMDLYPYIAIIVGLGHLPESVNKQQATISAFLDITSSQGNMLQPPRTREAKAGQGGRGRRGRWRSHLVP